MNNDPITQIKNYMKLCNISEGIIINFGQKEKKLDVVIIQGESVTVHEFRDT